MSSSDEAVNKILADLSRIPQNINSIMKIKNQDIEEKVKKILNEQLVGLKSRGVF